MILLSTTTVYGCLSDTSHVVVKGLMPR
jgi:hypothetical protein